MIREPQHEINNHIPNTYRFFEIPTVDSEYTYISDIDIMFLEDILPLYKKTGQKMFVIIISFVKKIY